MDSSAVGVVSRFVRRRWRWLVAGLVLMVMVTFGAGLYLGRIVERRLADAIAAADRDDRYWRIEDLMSHREVVPDAENSALVLAKVLPLMPESWPNAPEPKSGEPTPPAQEAKDAFERLSAAADNIRLDQATAGVLRGELKKYDEVVRIARTVSEYRRGRYDRKRESTPIDTLPETQAAHSVAKLLAADAAIRAHDGDLDGALDSCRAVLGVARSIGDEPSLRTQEVRIDIDSIAMNSARRVLAQGEPSDAALARLEALILDEMAQPIPLYSVRGDRALWEELTRGLGAGEGPIFDPNERGEREELRRALKAIAAWGKLMFDTQRATGLEWLNAAAGIARRPAAERPALWDALQSDLDRVEQSWFGTFTVQFSIYFLIPPISVVGSADSRIQCELATTAILLAAERHRRKSGDWPASIAAIDPGILSSAPVDPYLGEAFRMERREGRLWIYSIGPNRKDEHGAYEPKNWDGDRPDEMGAIGWDVAARRQPPPPEKEGHNRSPASP